MPDASLAMPRTAPFIAPFIAPLIGPYDAEAENGSGFDHRTGVDQLSGASPDRLGEPYFLLGCFADFYEEVAAIKVAQAEGRLGAYLSAAGVTAPVTAADYAGRVSARLDLILQQQARAMRNRGTATEIKAYNLARYAMAALADEIFILDLAWPGREAWLDVLLETRLFQTRNAGSRFFELVQQLLARSQRNTLHRALAPVFLLALQLGFKGLYRGGQGEATLRDLRQQLYRLVQQEGLAPARQAAFPQAYLHRLSGKRDQRLASLSSWYAAGWIALAAYVALSTLVWVARLLPFEAAFV